MCRDNVISEYPVSKACLAVLRLSSIKGLGLKSFHLLFDYFSSAEKVLCASYESLLLSGIKPKLAQAIAFQNENSSIVIGAYESRLFEWAARKNNYVLCLEDDAYPESLKEVFCPPPLLYVQGNLSAFDRISVAVIGSRRPSLSGQKHAKAFSVTLAELNICVTSGLAIGIDTFAHQGALEAKGVSCAVLGSGLEQIYPKQNQNLAMALKEQGVLVSELGLDVKALPANFPRRNRVISGLSQGVLVVEAGLKSGSLITADFALEQGRDVFAIPGVIDHPLSRGCHALIKQGATLVETVDDILNQLGSDLASTKPKNLKTQSVKGFSHLSKEEQKVISVLGHESTSFDDLLHCLDMKVTELNTVLVTLELKGELSNVLGGYQRI